MRDISVVLSLSHAKALKLPEAQPHLQANICSLCGLAGEGRKDTIKRTFVHFVSSYETNICSREHLFA